MEVAQEMAPERSVRPEGAEEPLEVQGDALRLKQVLLNLLTNALTYAPGSPIDVQVRRTDDAAEVQITDRGPGIAADALPHLFTRFYQVAGEEAYTRGMGLGLYISREIMEAHGGQITVDTQVGVGSTFTARLPLDRKRAKD
jgi:two-component system CheB/CheR fusion protein